jgi:hypothetical protein
MAASIPAVLVTGMVVAMVFSVVANGCRGKLSLLSRFHGRSSWPLPMIRAAAESH